MQPDQIRRRIASLEAELSRKTVEMESKKIQINGNFGKLGSQHSVLYSPDLMIQVTVTGQLALLMLIERAELAGIPVISGNTDGVVFKCPRHLEPTLLEVVQQWEADTGFVTEETRYKGLYSANVNNYIAIKEDGSHKGKGWFFNPWEGDKPDYRGQLSKNPQTTVCVSAVVAYLTAGTPLADTIHACQDIRQFVTVRKVNGGAVWQGQYLGKAVRWYYAKGQFEPIRYASNGNRVSKSDGAMPCMEIPDALPADIDYDWYEREAQSMLVDIGAVQGPRRRGEPDERQVDLFAAEVA